MNRIAELVFEALFLKKVPRSGYQFLGVGRESVAEHVYAATFIAFVLSRLEPAADAERLIAMCLVHDLPEARIGDMNHVQKRYVTTDEQTALTDALQGIAWADQVKALVAEFNAGATLEAKLARDADQLSLLADLKALQDLGHPTPRQWLPHVQQRLLTQTARDLAAALTASARDDWWFRLFH
jgi:putative hydrolases of HD superfamily